VHAALRIWPGSSNQIAAIWQEPRWGSARGRAPGAVASRPVFAFVEFLREIPLTATNKPDRKALTAIAEENARGRRRAT
jgi:hypothetical protein